MYLGNSQINEQFLGDTPINSIWLGQTEIWHNNYTYEISDVKINYSSGDKVLCDGSNYVYPTCTLKTYQINSDNTKTLVRTQTNRKMNSTFKYASLGRYFTVDGEGKIAFDLADYGTEDMSYQSNPFTTSIQPYLNGQTGDSLYFSAEPNVLTSSTPTGYSISTSTVNPINAGTTTVYITVYSYQLFRYYYSSGKQNNGKQSINFYIYDRDTTTGPFIASGVSETQKTLTVTKNTNKYPVLHQYRIGYISVSQDDLDNLEAAGQPAPSSVSKDDYYLNFMQYSNTSYTEKETQAIYYGSTKLTDGCTINASQNIILMNDAKKAHSDLVYQFKSSSGLTVTESKGLIHVKGITPATNGWVSITTYKSVGKEEWWMEDPEPEKTTITFNIIA